MTFEEEHEDVLQNIEAALVGVYREHPEMVDWEALQAIESLARDYQAEAQGRAVTPRALTGACAEAAQAVRAVCDWRLGRNPLTDEHGHVLDVPPMSVDEIVACLKRIRKAIQRWNKEGGRQGSFKFVSQFIP